MENLILRGFVLASLFSLGNATWLVAQGGKAEPAAENRSVADLINGLRDSNVDKKVEALNALEKLGPKAKPAIPDLVSALRNMDARVQRGAIVVLGSIGPDAKETLPTLKQLLSESKPENSFHAHALIGSIMQISPRIDHDITRALVAHSTIKTGEALVLSFLHKHAAELTPHLIALLDDIDVNVRVRASQAFLRMSEPDQAKISIIKKLGDVAKPIAPALLKKLDDPSSSAAIAAARALTHVDPELGTKAIPYVVRWLKDGTTAKEFNNSYAAYILQPVAKAAIPALIDALDDKDIVVRNQITAALAQVGGSLDPLIKALDHEKMYVRAGAAKAIATLYSGGAKAAPALANALKDPELVVRYAAAAALVWTGTNRMREAVPVLVEVMRDQSKEDKQHAAYLLTRIGPAAKSAVPDLIALMKDEHLPVRLEAALALSAIDVGAASKAVGVLIEGLGSSNQFHPRQSAKALAEIGPPAKDAVPALEKLFDSKDVHARYSAAEAVARIDPSKVESAVKVLAATLKDPKNLNSMVRVYALTSLRKIGPAAKTATPALEEMLGDDGSFHAEVAITAICLAGEDARVAIKYIREHILKDSDDPDAYDIIDFFPNLGAHARIFLPEIRTVLESTKVPRFQELMCDAIAEVGPNAKDLEPQLKALIQKSKRKSTVEAAEKALAAIGAKN